MDFGPLGGSFLSLSLSLSPFLARLFPPLDNSIYYPGIGGFIYSNLLGSFEATKMDTRIRPSAFKRTNVINMMLVTAIAISMKQNDPTVLKKVLVDIDMEWILSEKLPSLQRDEEEWLRQFNNL